MWDVETASCLQKLPETEALGRARGSQPVSDVQEVSKDNAAYSTFLGGVIDVIDLVQVQGIQEPSWCR